MYLLLGILTAICIGILLILCTHKILISKELVNDINYDPRKIPGSKSNLLYETINVTRYKYTCTHLLSNKTTIKYKTFVTFISSMYASEQDSAFRGTMELEKWKFDSILEPDFYIR
jgi:hypothetical protein